MSSSASDELDQQIADLSDEVASLKRQLAVQATTLISSESAKHILSTLSVELDFLSLPPDPASLKEKLLARSRTQEAYNQQCLYRTCAAVTTFRIQDPDPNAVDDGHVLGIRIEVMNKGRFLRPYYVMLNKPYRGSRHLRIHRHTVPPYIPLPGLAARYLPPPRSDGATSKQDLPRLVRSLRREIVRYHNRAAVITDLARAVGSSRDKTTAAENPEAEEEEEEEEAEPTPGQGIIGIRPADNVAKQVTIEWKDGRTGRLVMDDDGQVKKLVVFGERGRDRDVTGRVLRGGSRIEDVASRLRDT